VGRITTDPPAASRSRRTIPPVAIIAALFALAFLARMPFLSTPMYGDEAVQYTMARHWGDYRSRGNDLVTGEHVDYRLVFWQRPAFPIALSPGALFGNLGMRVELVLLTSLLAPLGFEVLRRMDVTRGWAVAGGAAVAVHPILVLWGTRVFPDALAAVFLLAALVAELHRRSGIAATLLVASAWSKEVVLPAVLGFGLLGLAGFIRDRLAGARPDWRPLLYYGGAILLAPLPLLYVISEGARPPGWTFSGDYMVARLFVGLWSIPLLLYLVFRRPRSHLSWLAIGFPLLFIADHFVRRVTIEEWYFVVPTLVVLLAVPVALNDLLSPLSARLRNVNRHSAPIAMASIMVLVVLLPAAGSPAVTTLGFASPQRQSGSYFEVLEAARRENHDLPPTVDRVRAELPSQIVLVNPGWYNIEYPWADVAGEIRYVFTPPQGDDWQYERLDEEMRRPNTVTVLHRVQPVGAVFERVEARYAGCKLQDLPDYFVVRASDCPEVRDDPPLLPALGSIQPSIA
jgi:hypothetical protein